MRRLGEILAFPRAWYRRSIARRLFLGDTNEQHQTAPISPQVGKKVQKHTVTTVKQSQIRLVQYQQNNCHRIRN